MNIDLAFEAALDGDSVMFAGAGFSRGATDITGSPFKQGKELAIDLAEESGLPADAELNESSEAYLEEHGADALIKKLQNLFTAAEVCDYHRIVARVPWKRIYTTNYDNVVERSCALEGVRCTPITTGLNIHDIPKDHTLCVHLNGYVQNLGREALQSELKLTDSSYLTASLEGSPWVSMLRQDLRTARSIFFLGYSLYDVDIRKLLVQSDLIKSKCFFVMPSPNVLLQKRVDRFGTIIPLTVKDYAERLLAKSNDYTPIEQGAVTVLSLKEWSAHVDDQKTSIITDQDFLKLLSYGDFQESCIAESLRSGKTYYLRRSATQSVMKLLEVQKIVAVCADLGNGKTMFARGIIREAREHGYRVFETLEKTEDAIIELSKIASLNEKVLIIIDGYQNWIDEIRDFFLNASDSVRLLVTIRGALHEVLVDDLCSAAGVTSIQEVRLDTLNLQERTWFVSAFDEYGIWGEFAGKSKERKQKFLLSDCQSQTHALLLKLLASPHIHEKLKLLSNRLAVNKPEYTAILSIFLLAAMNYTPTLETLADICGLGLVSGSKFRNDPDIRQLIDFSIDRISVRSATAAQYFLSKVADTSITVSALISMARAADERARTMVKYKSLYGDLMKYRNLQHIFSDEGRTAALFRFYENVKNLSGSKNNPLFWLQYAIASMVARDLPRAKRYFDTAYSLALSQRWNTFQIDNHYARYLLVDAIEHLAPDKAMENFREARSIINQQIRDEKHYNPYRVAIEYKGFVDRFFSNLSRQNVQEIAEASRACHALGMR